MGCFNESCMVTGLPISYKEPCSLVFLLESPYCSNNCYATNAYTPIFIMDGIYNDYGCIEDADTKEFKALTDLFFACIPGGQDISPENRLAEFVNRASQCETIISHAAGVLDYAKTELHLYPIFLHGRIKDLAKQNMQENHASFQTRIRKLLSNIEANAYGNLSDDDDDTAEAYFRLHDYMRELMNHCLCESSTNPAASDFLSGCVRADKNTALPMIERLVETTVFLSDLRKAWHIPSGGGSQEGLTGAHIMLHNLCGELIEGMETDND